MKKDELKNSIDSNDPSTWPTPPTHIAAKRYRSTQKVYENRNPNVLYYRNELKKFEDRFIKIVRVLDRSHDHLNRISKKLDQEAPLTQKETLEFKHILHGYTQKMDDLFKIIQKYYLDGKEAKHSLKMEITKNYRIMINLHNHVRKNLTETRKKQIERLQKNLEKISKIRNKRQEIASKKDRGIG